MKLLVTHRFQRIDWGIIISTLILVLISLATLYSLEINKSQPDYTLLKHQTVAAILGVGLLVACTLIDFRIFKDYAYHLYIAGCALLVLVLIFGQTIRGTTGWFQFAGLTFQPVEAFKIILIIALAKFFSDKTDVNARATLFKAVLWLVVPTILIYAQPDLGSLIVLICIWVVMMVVMKLRPYYLLVFFLTSLTVLAFAWQFWFKSYQRERIDDFLTSISSPMDASYHVRQAQIAVGSGRWIGRGLGLGTQSSLNFLPEQATDFIFAVIAESLGFLGAVLVIALYTYFLYRIWKLARYLKDDFAALLTVGIFAWFAFQGLANIAMNLGLIPVFGVPLPLVSYGGSSLLVSLLAIGILESISIRSHYYD